MPALRYAQQSYRRDVGDEVQLRLRNMYPEPVPSEEDGVVLISRPGMVPDFTVGTTQIKGLYAEPGVFNGDRFVLAFDNTLYRETTQIGTVTGANRVSWAAGSSQLLVTTNNGPVFVYNGTTTKPAAFPDNADVSAVAYLAGYFVAIRSGTGRIYWSALLDGSKWGGLDYATAESSPDDLLDLYRIGDVLYLLGQSSVEVWAPTGDADLPFARVEGRTFPKGIIGTGAAAEVDGTLFWVGGDAVFYRDGQRVSDYGIEERIRQSGPLYCFSFRWQGHTFFCCSISGVGSYLYDIATGVWTEFASFGKANWLPRCAVNIGTNAYFGDRYTNTIWRFDDSNLNDGSTLERSFDAILPVKSGGFAIDSVQLRVNAGRVTTTINPQIGMMQSRDLGKTFGPTRMQSLGVAGAYRTRVTWRRCGMADEPGTVFRFTCTDPTPLRVTAVLANEPFGGRAR